MLFTKEEWGLGATIGVMAVAISAPDWAANALGVHASLGSSSVLFGALVAFSTGILRQVGNVKPHWRAAVLKTQLHEIAFYAVIAFILSLLATIIAWAIAGTHWIAAGTFVLATILGLYGLTHSR